MAFRVTVHAVGFLRAHLAAGGLPVTVEVEPGTTVEALLNHLDVPTKEVWRVAVNGTVSSLSHSLENGDSVTVLPPIGGG
jgi:sulfur carrier protein ThiS